MTVRELAVQLGLDVNAQSFVKGQLAVDAITAAAGYAVEALNGMVSSFTAAIVSFAKDTVGLDDSAKALSITSASLQSLEVSAIAAGASTAALRQGLTHLDANIPGKVDAAFLKLADHIASLPAGATRAKAATKALGTAGAALVPLLEQGAGALKAMQARIGPFQAAVADLVGRYKAWRKANDEVIRQRLAAVVGAVAVAIGYLAKGLLAVINAAERAWAFIRPFFVRWGESLTNIGHLLADIARVLYDRIGRALSYVADKARQAFTFVTENFQKVKDFIGKNGLELAVGALAIAFEYLGVAGSISALKTAASWALTLAEFAAIAAVLGAMYLAFDDVATYQESIRRGGTGKNTIYGKWKIQIDEMISKFKTFIADWMKPNGEDPWWLQAVKALVRYLDKAYGIAEKLHLSTAPVREADANTWTSRGLRAVGVSDPAWVGRVPGSKLTRDEDLPDYARPGYKPYYAPLGPAGTGTVLAPSIGNVTFQTTVQPGQNPEAYAAAQRAMWENWWDGKMEESAAALPATQ